MNTRESYPKGCRVVATAKYREQFPRSSPQLTGQVIGYGRDGKSVRVKRDGHRAAATYHWHFWDRIV